MNSNPVATSVWDEVDSGPAVCLADISEEGKPYKPCGKKLREGADEYGEYWECTKHGPMH